MTFLLGPLIRILPQATDFEYLPLLATNVFMWHFSIAMYNLHLQQISNGYNLRKHYNLIPILIFI